MKAAEDLPQSRFRRLAVGEEGRALRQQLFSAAAALLIATLVLMGSSLANLRSSLQESVSAEDSMLELTTIESRLVDFDRAVGAYALTGDAKYQLFMDDTYSQLETAATKLHHSLQDKPEQFKVYEELAGMLRTWQGLARELHKPEHRKDLATLPEWRAEKRVVAQARGKLWQILLSERANRYANNRRMIEEARSSFWLAVVFIVISLAAGLGFFGIRNTTGGSKPRPH